jgi:hypothetical protein
VQRMDPPVSGAALSDDESSLFEVVDEHDHAAGRHAELVRHSLLTAARAVGYGAQHTNVRRSDPQRRYPLREHRRRMGSDLRD